MRQKPLDPSITPYPISAQFSISIPSENIRKPENFRLFKEVQKWNIDPKWVNLAPDTDVLDLPALPYAVILLFFSFSASLVLHQLQPSIVFLMLETRIEMVFSFLKIESPYWLVVDWQSHPHCPDFCIHNMHCQQSIYQP